MIESTPGPDAPAGVQQPARGRTFGFDILLTVGGKGVFAVLGAVMTVVIARTLGPSGQGIFAVAFNLSLLLVQTGNLGLPIANPYFAARDPLAQRAIVLSSLRIAAGAAAVLSAGAVLVKVLAPGTLPGIGGLELAITLSALPASLATVYLQGVLLGQRRMVPYNLVEVIQVASSLALLLVAIAVTEVGVAAVLLIVVGGRYVSLAVALVALIGVLRVPAAPHPDLTRRLLRHGSRVYVVGLLTFVLIRLDLLLVNAVVGAEAAGQYSVAAFVAEGLVLVPIVVGTNLVPRLAVTAENNLLVLVFRTLLVVWGGICLLSIPGAAVGIPLLFGERYEAAVELYLWLLPGTFAMGMLNSLTVHYFVRGYPPALMAAWALGLVLNVALNLVLLPGLGVVAAPVLSSLAYAGVLLAHVLLFARDVGGPAALRPRPREVVGLVRGSFKA